MDQATSDKLALLRAARTNVLRIYRSCTPAQLNHVPPGLNNNLVWNAGHVVATLEGLVYGLSGLRTPATAEFIGRYRKGSRPEGPVGQAEIDHIGQRLLAGVDQLEEDLATLDFGNYRTYETSFGVTLRDVGDALTFNNMHEAMHLGTMIALRRLVADV